MIQNILIDPNPALRKRAKEVDASLLKSADVKNVIRDLRDTLAVSEDGIGVAAPQIGASVRIFIVSEEAKYIDNERPEKTKEWEQLVYINPVITKFSKTKIERMEGCLSVPGKYGSVARPEKIHVDALDENGQKISHGAAKFFARVIQHELDHLDGILFIDKAKRIQTIASEESRL